MKLNKNSPAKKKLIRHLKSSDRTLNDKNVIPILNGIERFVKVMQKMYTEPQAQISYKNKNRIIETDFEEFKKVLNNGKHNSITTAFSNLHESITKEKIIRENNE